MKKLNIQEIKIVDNTPASSDVGFIKIYPKNDKNIYILDENGNEIRLLTNNEITDINARKYTWFKLW